MILQSEKIPTRSNKEQLIDIDLHNLGQEVDALNTAVSAIPVYTETVVDISAAQILAMGSTPIELLPAPGSGKYYVIDKICIEYKFKTTSYSFSSSPTFYLDGCFDSYVDRAILTTSADSVCVLSGNLRNTITIGSGSGSVKVITNRDVLNAGLTMASTNGDNPTGGDGLVRVIISYMVNTMTI